MNTSRLKTLRRALLEHEDNGIRFDMGHWWDKYACDRGEDGTTHWCGTSACAMGLATEIPEFKQQGLRRISNAIFMKDDCGTLIKGGFRAARQLFDISMSDTFWLFAAGSYKGRRANAGTVSRRIREYIRTNGESSRLC